MSGSRSSVGVVLFAVAAAAAACGGATAGSSEPNRPRADPVVADGAEVTPAEGASAVDVPCAEDAIESENAADDDCDGRIDEDRPGDASRELTVAVTWGDASDVDLVVAGPGAGAADEGGMQRGRAGRGACEPGAAHSRIEDVRWPAPRPGTYGVALVSASACGQPAAETIAAVTVALRGHALGTWSVRVPAGGRAEALTIELR